ncbi:MAG: alpha/beta hydrolase fold domain-containing protein [Maioricimonas sp. JB049]
MSHPLRPLHLLLATIICLLSGRDAARAQSPPAQGAINVVRDLTYATVGNAALRLDLYRPAAAEQPPLIVWIHGGAWRAGSKQRMPLGWLVKKGYAVASIDYRLSPVARFPAQIHDCKAAIRFLRAKQKEYGYNADHIAVAGSSAGGHLAALVGVTNGHPSLEGTIGAHLEQSSNVAAIIDWYGPTNFMTILQQSTPHGLSVRVPALQLLIGDRPENVPDPARLASPVFHVDEADPPLLILHGDQDPQVPINQSHELQARYKQHGLPVQFEVVHGGAHGGELFFDAPRRKLVEDFLDEHLRNADR